MAKGTLIILFLLSITASLLFGINIGKTVSTKDNSAIKPAITPIISPISSSPSATPKRSKITGTLIFKNSACGFQFSYPGSYINEKTVNSDSVIFTDPDDPGSMIATTCAKAIPRPPVTADKIESIIIAKAPATLYHDQTKDKTPRDEIIVKHPGNGMEIIIAGYGDSFQKALSSFKFL